MFAFSDVEPLIGWVWGETPEDENPFLIRASRMGCEYCPDDFSIVRDEGYRHFTVHMVFSGCSFFHVAGKDYLLKGRRVPDPRRGSPPVPQYGGRKTGVHVDRIL